MMTAGEIEACRPQRFEEGRAMALQRASRINALLRAVFFLPVLVCCVAALRSS